MFHNITTAVVGILPMKASASWLSGFEEISICFVFNPVSAMIFYIVRHCWKSRRIFVSIIWIRCSENWLILQINCLSRRTGPPNWLLLNVFHSSKSKLPPIQKNPDVAVDWILVWYIYIFFVLEFTMFCRLPLFEIIFFPFLNTNTKFFLYHFTRFFSKTIGSLENISWMNFEQKGEWLPWTYLYFEKRYLHFEIINCSVMFFIFHPEMLKFM